jgi:hypothetical protein
MRLLTERAQVQDVAERWRELYDVDGTYSLAKRWRKVYAELAALDTNTATADMVAEIVGNKSWVRPHYCDECGAVTWDIVEVGEQADYETRTANLCGDCLRAALRLLGGF